MQHLNIKGNIKHIYKNIGKESILNSWNALKVRDGKLKIQNTVKCNCGNGNKITPIKLDGYPTTDVQYLEIVKALTLWTT